MAEWRPLKYKDQDYGKRALISDDGQIKSVATGVILRQAIKPSGYRHINIFLGNGKRKTFLVHVAVASTFVDGYKPGLTVNHQDGDKSNNRADNLEWCTHKENTQHALQHGLLKFCKKIKCVNNNTIFNSVLEASRWCGLKSTDSIYSFLNGKQKTAGKDPMTGEKLIWEMMD